MGVFCADAAKFFLLKNLSVASVVGQVFFLKHSVSVKANSLGNGSILFINNVFHGVYGTYVLLPDSRVIWCTSGSFLQSKVTSKDNSSGNSSRVSILCEPIKKIFFVLLPLICNGSCIPILPLSRRVISSLISSNTSLISKCRISCSTCTCITLQGLWPLFTATKLPCINLYEGKSHGSILIWV